MEEVNSSAKSEINKYIFSRSMQAVKYFELERLETLMPKFSLKGKIEITFVRRSGKGMKI